MTELRTISPDELPELSEVPENLRAVVFSPAGPLQSMPYERLLAKLIGASLTKVSKAALDADLAHPADSVALVFNDPTAANNGWYRKLGASGAGSWDQFEELARNSRILAAAAAEAAAAALGEVQEAAATAAASLGEIIAAGEEQVAAVQTEGAVQVALATAQAEAAAAAAASINPQTVLTQIEGFAPAFPMVFEPGIAASVISSFTDPNAMTLGQNGFARVGAAGRERRCLDAAGNYVGSLMRPPASYIGAPWNDPGAPHGTGDPARLNGTNANLATLQYAGAHSGADIFGGTGGGVRIAFGGNANSFWVAPNVGFTANAGELVRIGMILRIAPGQSGVHQLRLGSNLFAFNYDASGNITGFTDNWGTWRADFLRYPRLINGQQFWFIWAERRFTSTTVITAGFGNPGTPTGEMWVQDLWLQRNPADAPCAVPVCGTFNLAADRIRTNAKTQIGVVARGAGWCRSIAANGEIVTPAIQSGLPYLPICTRMDVVNSTEVADRAGPLPNRRRRFYTRPWGATASNTSLLFGPGVWDQERLGGSTPQDATQTIAVRSVFENRPDLTPILSPNQSSATFVANVDIDGVRMMGMGDLRTKYSEQSDVVILSGATFALQATGNLGVTNSLVLGQTLHLTRAAHEVQEDEGFATAFAPNRKQVYVGELALQTTTGGTLSVRGTRTHRLARTALSGASSATSVTLDTRNFCTTEAWMDSIFLGQMNVVGWLGDFMFQGRNTGMTDPFLCQSERPIQISLDGGATFAAINFATNPITSLPHGALARHIGTWNFDTNTFNAAPDTAKQVRVRYYYRGSVAGIFDKPGFQWQASQMIVGDHQRWPTNGDVFEVRKGNLVLRFTFQAGRWTTNSNYERFVGAAANNPASLVMGVSNDGVQVDRSSVVMAGPVVIRDLVSFVEKGALFMTGDPGLGPTGSIIANFTAERFIGLHQGTNSIRVDHSRQAGSQALLRNVIAIEVRDRFTFGDGSGKTLTLGAAGANMTLTVDNVIVASSSLSGGVAIQNGATLVGTVRHIPGRNRQSYNVFGALPAASGFPSLLPAELYNDAQGAAIYPAPEHLFSFRVTDYCEDTAGWPINATVERCVGNHPRWDAVIRDMEAKWFKTPELRAQIVNTAAVGTVLGTVADTGFDDLEGGSGAIDGWFEIVGGQLRVAQALTGQNRIFVMRGNAGSLIVVDVRAT